MQEGSTDAPGSASVPESSWIFATLLVGGLATVVGGTVLVGWAFDIAELKSIPAGWVTVKPNTALAFILSGVALLVLAARSPDPKATPSATAMGLGRVCALLTAAIGLLTLSEYLFEWNGGFDQWIFLEAPAAVGTSHPGRMAPDTAFCFAMAGVALWLLASPRRSRRRSSAIAMLGSAVAIAGAIEILTFLTPAVRANGWGGLTMMALPTAVLFTLQGATIAVLSWRGALDSQLTRFSTHLRRTAACLAAGAICFNLCVRSAGEIPHAYDLRHRSILLASELRQSSEDLARMARNYVLTSEPSFKRHFREILDIRDGRRPRPEGYWRPYWDLVLADGAAPRSDGSATPLLALMRQADLTPTEFALVAEAKAHSDALAEVQAEAIRLAESTGARAEADRSRARGMVSDESYFQAKAEVMRPIDRFLQRVDERTSAAVRAAELSAQTYLYLLALCGCALVLVLWRAYVALGDTLGGSVDEVAAHIERIGRGDFAAAIPLRAGLEESVLGWLAQTRARLSDYDRARKATEHETAQQNLLLNALVNSPGDLVIFSLDRNFCYTAFNEKHRQEMRKVWDADIRLGGSLLESMSDSGLRALARQSIERALAGEAFTEVHDQPGAEISYEFNWSPIRQDDGGVTGVTAFIRDITERQRAQERVQNSETFLNRVIEQSPSSTWIADAKGTLLRANAACCALLHITEEEVVGRYNLFEDNIVAEQGYLPLVHSVFESGETARFELIYDSSHLAGMALRDTVALILDVTIFPIRDNHGRITNAVVQHLDITERRRAETALKENERARSELLERLNSAQQFAAIGSWELNVVTNEVWWSDETYRIFGVTPEQHIPSVASNARFIHPEDRERYGDLFEHCLRTGSPLETEVRLVTDGGLLKHCEVKGTAVVDDYGLTARFFGTIMDVSERKQAEAKLVEAQRLRTLAEKLGKVGSWEFDTETKALTWTEEVFHIHEVDLTYQPTVDEGVKFYAPESRPKIARAVQRAIELGEPFDLELQIITAKGNRRHVHSIGMADPTRRKVLGFFQDITAQKRAEEEVRNLNVELELRVHERTEQLERANRELEAFSYSVSHDLRAPLRAIDGFGHILLQDYGSNLDPEGRRVLGVIASETRRMGRLIDDLLAFSHLGRHKLEAVEIDMQAMARAIFEDQVAQSPLRAFELDLQPIPSAHGDLAMIRVVWTNLLSNAIKFTQGRSPARITIGSHREEGQNVYLIRDNGAGFDMRYAEKLFGVFQRLHSADEFEGTGVGLALVQRVIHRHGGRVWGEGTVDGGATFCFTLPSPGEEP